MSQEVQRFVADLLAKKKNELEAVELELIMAYEPEEDDDSQEVHDLEEKRDKLTDEIEELEEMS